jgi:hypothetical protein
VAKNTADFDTTIESLPSMVDFVESLAGQDEYSSVVLEDLSYTPAGGYSATFTMTR